VEPEPLTAEDLDRLDRLCRRANALAGGADKVDTVVLQTSCFVTAGTLPHGAPNKLAGTGVGEQGLVTAEFYAACHRLVPKLIATVRESQQPPAPEPEGPA
jgi:hypothetical protein